MKRLAWFVILLAYSCTAFAHVDKDVGGFTAGILHPVLGFDHLLAMVSVGVISAQIGGRAIWQIPATFVTVMLIGGITGIMGIPIPAFSVELGIAISVFALGIAIAIARKMPTLVVALCVGFFAIFHGHAHGIEMPDIKLPVYYVIGFVTGTALLHLTGVAIGLVSNKTSSSEGFLRHVGSGVAGIGFYLIFFV